MAEMRGRPFVYVALTLSIWVGLRVIISLDDNGSAATLPLPTIIQHPVTRDAPSIIVPVTTSVPTFPKLRGKRPSRLPRIPPVFNNFGLPPAQDPWQDGGRPPGLSLLALVASRDEPQSSGRDTPPSKALALTGEAGPPEREAKAQRGLGVEVYIYSFWRFSTVSEPALGPSAQYGGSQSGIIGTIDPFGTPDRGLSLLARGSGTPAGEEREVALGFRWRPANDWPLTFSAERRFRVGAPDGYAAYLAGGFDTQPIAGRLSLDGFGQVGYVTGQTGGGFFDVQARAMHPLIKISGVPLSSGAGAWAGGQKGALRADVGPSLAAKVDTGLTPLLIQLDWRLRVAGNAETKNGFTLTVSTGF